MDNNKLIEIVLKWLFIVYAITCLTVTELWYSVMIVPLVILSYGFITVSPKGICIISKERETALSVMGHVARRLDIEEIYIYEASSEDDISNLGVYDEDTDLLYEFEDEEDEY